MADAFGGMNMRGKSKFGGVSSAKGKAEAADDGRFGGMSASEVQDRFLLRLKIGMPLVLYKSRGRGKARVKHFVEMYTENNGRTLKVDFITEEKFLGLAKAANRLQREDAAALQMAATERAKLREMESLKVEFMKRTTETNFELRTVDIKELWQADVEYGEVQKHTIMDWADGTNLDLEGFDMDETLFLHKGLTLCIGDWTKATTEYSDFWDSL